MTITPIRPRVRTNPDVDPRVREVEQHIAQIRAALEDPHGWGDELAAELGKLEALHAELVALTARHILAA